MSNYNVINLNGVREVTGAIGTWAAPNSVTCSDYAVTHISVYSTGGNSTFTVNFMSGSMVLADGVGYDISLPAPTTGVTLALTAIDATTSFMYSIVGVK